MEGASIYDHRHLATPPKGRPDGRRTPPGRAAHRNRRNAAELVQVHGMAIDASAGRLSPAPGCCGPGRPAIPPSSPPGQGKRALHLQPAPAAPPEGPPRPERLEPPGPPRNGRRHGHQPLHFQPVNFVPAARPPVQFVPAGQPQNPYQQHHIFAFAVNIKVISGDTINITLPGFTKHSNLEIDNRNGLIICNNCGNIDISSPCSICMNSKRNNDKMIVLLLIDIFTDK